MKHEPTQQFQSLVREGHAKEKSALIIGLAKNIAGFLPNTKAYIEAIGAMFKKYAVVILENDSTDDTKEFLLSWSKENRNVNVDLSNYHQLDGSRTQVLAYLRNRLLELAWDMNRLKLNQAADIIVTVDLDIESIDLTGLNKAIGMVVNDGYVGITANGAWSDGKYWDIFALRNCEFAWDAHRGVLTNYDWNNTGLDQQMKIYPSNVPPVPVDSAFAGAAVYDAKAVFGRPSGAALTFGSSKESAASILETSDISQYGSSERIGAQTELPCSYGDGNKSDCEHIPFSVCLSGRAKAMNMKQIHMLPSWGILYGVRPDGPKVFTASSPLEVTIPSSAAAASEQDRERWVQGPICLKELNMISAGSRGDTGTTLFARSGT
jgi:hypothetical protein